MQKIHIVTFLNASEHLMLNAAFLVPKFSSCEYSLNHPNKSVLCLSRIFSKAVLHQHQSEQETEITTAVDT